MAFLLRTIGVILLAVFSTAYADTAEYDEFKHGYYISDRDKKVEGWLRYVKGMRPRIDYKVNEGDKKIKRLDAFDVKEFVMGSDIRFVRMPKAVIVRVGGLNRTLRNDFLRVFEEGKMSLYMHYTELESKSKNDFTPTDIDIPIIRMGDAELVPLSGDDNKTQAKLQDMFPRDNKAVRTLMSGKWDEIVKFVQEYNKK